jgi:glycine cleavage system H lipoate-binding protein
MKKILLCSVMALSLGVSVGALAETATGHVVETNGSSVTVQQENGQQVTMQTTPETTYRTKKIVKRNKIQDGKKMKKGDTYFQPMVEEDDFIEVIYSPSSGNVLIIEDVVIHDN